MKRVKVMMTSAVILLAIGGAFASRQRAQTVYTQLEDLYPYQVEECQVRGTCTGSGSLCRAVVFGLTYQLYYSGCYAPAHGQFVP